MKYSLPTTLLALTTMTLMVLTARSAGLRGLQSLTLDNNAVGNSFKISGVSHLIQAISSAGNYSNANFDTISINALNQTQTDNGTVYEATLNIANDQGVSVSAQLNGVWDPVNSNIALTATTYEIATQSTVGESADSSDNDDENGAPVNPALSVDADGYANIDIVTAQNDPQVAAAFQWGINELIVTGERQNKIPTSIYTVTSWVSASSKNRTRNIGYRFVAELLGANYVNVECNMTVFYDPTVQSYELAAYYYRASNITEGSLPNNNTNAGDESTGNNNSTAIDTNSTVVDSNTTVVDTNTTVVGTNPTVIDTNGTVIDTNTTVVDTNTTVVDTNATNATNTTAPIPTTPVITIIVPAGYTYLSPADFANNAQAQAALAFGNNALIQKIIGQYKLPTASPQYNVTNYMWGVYRNTSTGATYQFNVNLTNALDYKVDANLTVSYLAANQTYKLPAYSFRSYNYPARAIVVPQNNTSNSSNNTTNASGNSNVDVPTNNTVVVPNNGTVVAPINNTQPIIVPSTNQTASAGFAPISNFNNDSQAQAALRWGIQNIIQTAIRLKKVPAANPTYRVVSLDVANVKQQSVASTYQYQVGLTNPNGYRVDANMTVFYRYSNGAYTLTSYQFRAYNYSASALAGNNNNTTTTTPTTPVVTIPTVVDSTPSATNTTTSTPTVVDSTTPTVVDSATPTVVDSTTPTVVDSATPTVVDNTDATSQADPTADGPIVLDPSTGTVDLNPAPADEAVGPVVSDSAVGAL